MGKWEEGHPTKEDIAGTKKGPVFPRALEDLGEGEKAGLGGIAKTSMTTTYLLSTCYIPDTMTSVLPLLSHLMLTSSPPP